MELDFETKDAGVFSAWGYAGVVYVPFRLARMRRNTNSPQIPRLGSYPDSEGILYLICYIVVSYLTRYHVISPIRSQRRDFATHEVFQDLESMVRSVMPRGLSDLGGYKSWHL